MKVQNVTWFCFTFIFGCSSIAPTGSRGPASVYQNDDQDPVSKPKQGKLVFSGAPVVSSRTVDVCGVKFEEYGLKSGDPQVLIERKSEALRGSRLKYFVPDGVSFKQSVLRAEGEEYLRQIQYSYTPKNPILPNIPLTERGLDEKLCDEIKTYHRLASGLKKTYSFDGAAEASSRGRLTQNEVAVVSLRRSFQDSTEARRQTTKLLIVYDDLYGTEARELAQLKNNLGIPTLAVAVSELPGINKQDPIPTECQGAFLKECYHFWGDPIMGMSQLGVPSMKGFYAETKIWERYTRVAYIPGLIRAHLRELKKVNAVTGLFLLGPEEVLTPHYMHIEKYDHWERTPLMPQAKIHTDVFYAVPDLPLTVQINTHHDQIMPWVWSCKDVNNTVRMGNWCNDNEWRHWPTPALTANRWAPFVPLARTFRPTELLSSAWFQALPLESIVGVGRYPTQERFLGVKDETVADYVAKVARWHNELPNLKGNSVGSHGGSTTDTWIFEEEDNIIFRDVYGSASKIYASEFFVPLAKCAGCEYQTGHVVMQRVAAKNRTSMMITAHGGNFAAQAPYANGNVSSHYTGENSYRYELSELRKIAYKLPQYASVKIEEDGGKLIGHVFANSCSTSNFNIDSGLHDEFYRLDRTANQRSFAEQWLSMPDAGALNTFMNSDVGFGGGDNAYNQMFMRKIQASWDNCGTIGDAYRMVISDMVKGQSGGAWDWMLWNRQMLGSPMNAIAKPAAHCVLDVEIERN